MGELLNLGIMLVDPNGWPRLIREGMRWCAQLLVGAFAPWPGLLNVFVVLVLALGLLTGLLFGLWQLITLMHRAWRGAPALPLILSWHLSELIVFAAAGFWAAVRWFPAKEAGLLAQLVLCGLAIIVLMSECGLAWWRVAHPIQAKGFKRANVVILVLIGVVLVGWLALSTNWLPGRYQNWEPLLNHWL